MQVGIWEHSCTISTGLENNSYAEYKSMKNYQNLCIVKLTQVKPGLRKATFYAHYIKTYFSPLNDSCTRRLTIQAGIDAQSYPGYFCCGLFLRPVRHPQVLGWPSNGYTSP